MSITEYERHQLFTWFEEHMGKERATTMMNLVPPVGWGDVATERDVRQHAAMTRRDLQEHRAETKRALQEHRAETERALQEHRAETNRDLHELHDEIAMTRQELHNEIAMSRQELHDEIATTRHEIAAMEARLGRTVAGWLFASQTVVIAAVAVLLAID